MPRVYVSPSLQDANIGVGEYGTEENQMQLAGDVVVQLLQYNHLEVYRNNRNMTLQQAVADSNSKNVDIHVAIHSDAGGGRGCTAFYTSPNGKRLATDIYNFLSPITPASDRGVKNHESLYELNKTNAVAALLEVSFHDNAEDSVWIMNNIYTIGEAIAMGVCRYFNIEFKSPKQEVGMYLETMDTLQLQRTLNAMKITDKDGNALVEDGKCGTLTKSAIAKAKEFFSFILK